MTEVPEEYRSKTPARLSALAEESGLSEVLRMALTDAAAEIEGSEEAYAVLVNEIRDLRAKLVNTEANLRSALALIPRRG
ncbi:hypothetical protein [Paraburkholderia sp. SIMBA_054]|uniref:hypothetical protein n=1 Tax=Paraburkholderia sp. SIMBA_054 TaxID=3085795 RepID=UPI00397A2419